MKNILVLIIIGIVSVSLIACSSNESVEENTVAVSTESEVQEDEKVVPERKAEVSGVVKSIVGNEVTISLLDKANSENQDQAASEELTEEEKAAKQAENQATKGSGSSSSGTGMTDVTLSGETVDIIIPVGTRVVKSDGTGELIELNIGDIFKGDSVKIWLLEGGDDSAQIAEFVQVLDQ